MYPSLPKTLQTAMLLATLPEAWPDMGAVRDGLAAWAPGRATSLTLHETGLNSFQLVGRAIVCTVVFSDIPLPQRGFGGALQLLGTDKAADRLRSIVSGHVAHVLIEVTSVLPETLENFDERLQLTKSLALALNAAVPADAVHWGQTDRLMDGPSFGRLASERVPLTLFTGPSVARSGRGLTATHAVTVDGAEHLIGTGLRFAFDRQKPDDSYSQCLDFLAHCRQYGKVPAEGDWFRTRSGVRLSVRHLPADAEYPHGCVELSRAGSTERAPLRSEGRFPMLDSAAQAVRAIEEPLPGLRRPLAYGFVAYLVAAAVLPTLPGAINDTTTRMLQSQFHVGATDR